MPFQGAVVVTTHFVATLFAFLLKESWCCRVLYFHLAFCRRRLSCFAQVVASAEEAVFALTMLPLALMVGLGLFQVDWKVVSTPPALGDVDWRMFIQIMFWTSTYWQKVR